MSGVWGVGGGEVGGGEEKSMTLVYVLVAWALAQVVFCIWWSHHQRKRKELHEWMMQRLWEERNDGQ